MDNALYVSLSRQVTLQRSLEVTANNLANVDTAGFKVEQLVVNEDPLDVKAPLNTPVRYALDTSVARDFAPGVAELTGNPLDVAIDGDGFFTVQTASGPRYTRDGRFSMDAQGTLVDKAGNPVLSNGGSPITFDQKKSTPSIGKDGTVSQDGQQVAKLGVVRFPSRAPLSKDGQNYFSSPASNAPVPANDAQVRQSFVERSNVQPVLEVTNLISISRTYERIAQIINSTTELSKTAIDRLGRVA
jgi:flagellar basal-body rod protein FlgF